jgi:murein DD-endopeptidase MepM/ murein hydrolase activator NlpD
LAQHRSSRSPAAAGSGASTGTDRVEPSASEITDIIPFNEFGCLDELEFFYHAAFDTEAKVLGAPELDDLNDITEPTPMRLVVPREFRSSTAARRTHRYRDDMDDTATGQAARDAATDVIPIRRGNHRKQTATVDAVKGRLLIAAMATGAAAAAAHAAVHTPDAHASATVLAARQSPMNGGTIETSNGVEIVPVSSTSNSSLAGEEMAKGVAFAQERAEREARMERPLYVMPTKGIFTSGFGYRWGVLHAGIDIANAIGTPILAVADGVVIDAGPAAGFGMWVVLKHGDGTVTVYGHVNTINVKVGQRVIAGDQIATMGNRGNSTGPHLHFEVHLNGTNKIDPLPWLAARGLSIGRYAG